MVRIPHFPTAKKKKIQGFSLRARQEDSSRQALCPLKRARRTEGPPVKVRPPPCVLLGADPAHCAHVISYCMAFWPRCRRVRAGRAQCRLSGGAAPQQLLRLVLRVSCPCCMPPCGRAIAEWSILYGLGLPRVPEFYTRVPGCPVARIKRVRPLFTTRCNSPTQSYCYNQKPKIRASL